MYELIEENFGGWLARLALAATALGIVAGGFSAVVLALYYAHTKAVSPMLQTIPALPAEGWQTAVIALGASLVIVGIVAGGLYWRFVGWRRTMYGAIESYVASHTTPLKAHVEYLQNESAGLQSVKEHDKWIESRLDKLEKHAASVHTVKHYCQSLEKEIAELQTHTGLPPKGPAQTLAELLGASTGIGSVGQIVEGPFGPS